MNKIYQGDCREIMRQWDDECIDLTVTSPPYDNLRDYQGYNFDFEGIARDLYRITKQGGVVVWIVGDQTIDGSETGTSFKQVLYFKKIGFNLHDTMIYLKDGTGYPGEKYRYIQSFEYMFILSRGTPKVFNPIKTQNKHYSEIPKISTYRKVSGETEAKAMLVHREGMVYNCWYYLTGYMKSTKDIIAFEHPAIFPEMLARDHIVSWSNEQDLILDPMCGSGTVCKMAQALNRKYVGIDISEEYCGITKKRLSQGWLV